MQAEKPQGKENKKSKMQPMEAAAGGALPPPGNNRRTGAIPGVSSTANRTIWSNNRPEQALGRTMREAVEKHDAEEKKRQDAAGTLIADLRTPPSNVSNHTCHGSNPPPAPSIARKPLVMDGFYNMSYDPDLYHGINDVAPFTSGCGRYAMPYQRVSSGRSSAPPCLPSPEQQRRQGLHSNPQLAVALKKESIASRKKAPSKSAKGGSGSKGGAAGWFTEDERSSLFDTIKKKLPIGKAEWEKVADDYNSNNVRHRELPSLRAQFNKYALAKPPTGDPNCPPLVRQAKQIANMIKEKAGLENMQAGVGADPFNAPYSSSNDTTPNTVDTSKSQTKAVRKKAKQDSIMEYMMLSDMKETQRRAEESHQAREDRMQMMTVLASTVTAIATAWSGRQVELPMFSTSARAPEAAVDSPLTQASADKEKKEPVEDIDWGSLKLSSSDSDDDTFDRGVSFKHRLARKRAHDAKKRMRKQKKRKEKEELAEKEAGKKQKVPRLSQGLSQSQTELLEDADSSDEDCVELDPVEYYGRKAKEDEEEEKKKNGDTADKNSSRAI
ncbi:unknown protein [Seminavis robusta]|uniref:DUF6818 domain-containing protein n=1 Tax=Seminavis robusta TaxID=568900 RepID=A0A9N8ET82_9STRA|nr:unknown protein [Seminavis robusta]|eukprot:Sro1561_g282660.1 n/a (554) ;mRNA; r:21107-22768